MIKLERVLGNEKEKECVELLRFYAVENIDNSYLMYFDNIDIPVGVLEYREHGDSVHVDYICTFEGYRNQGIASCVIKTLNEDYAITGNSVIDALGFWQKLGAEFEEDITIKENLDYYIENNLCVPFIIH